MAGLTACSGPPQEQIVPWVRQPEGMSPSLPLFHATTLRHGDDNAGVLVETHQRRPAKIEGNPNHPASLGATDAILQAAVLELWDQDRSSAPKHHGVIASWDDFDAEAAALRRRFATDGRALRVLGGCIDSPTLARQREQFLQRFPRGPSSGVVPRSAPSAISSCSAFPTAACAACSVIRATASTV